MLNTAASPKRSPIAVAVGVVINDQQEVLIALRSTAQEQGGLWEFPGGKIEAGESDMQGLVRELAEEVGIKVITAEALTNIKHNYGDKSVDLRFILVPEFCGDAVGKEGQEIKWVSMNDLSQYSFPAANQLIIPWLMKKYHCS
jgi:8-oxo-dGTP diphosphatase